MNDRDFVNFTEKAVKRDYRSLYGMFFKDADGIQKVQTPWVLCEELVENLTKFINISTAKIAVIYNVEFIDVLCKFGANKNNIVFITDSGLRAFAAQEWYNSETIMITPEEIKMKKGKVAIKKFDVVIGNPPYQPPQKQSAGGDGSRNKIWDKFVKLALHLAKDDGHIAYIHPSLWRKPSAEIWEEYKNHRLLYLEIHNDQDGLKTFGASTRYDWYVLHKNQKGLTIVKDEKGDTNEVNLQLWPFLPNHSLPLLNRILAKDGEECANIMFSYKYHETRKPWMKEEQDREFQYPCIHATPKTAEVKIWYSSKKSEFFGVPKVIFGEARHITNVIIDDLGEYGMTQGAMALPINSKNEGEQIKKALETESFNNFLEACRWSSFRIDFRMFKFFRRDFWKEFV